MKEIMLSQDKVTIVDDEDYEYLSKQKWSFHNGYAVGYDKEKKKQIKIHRFIMEKQLQESIIPNARLDHIDGDKLNNQKYNLRIVTAQQNSMNSKMQIDNKSGYKGIAIQTHKCKDGSLSKYWQAKIQYNGKTIRLGTYGTPEEAAKKYNEAAIKYFGEYAKLNKF